MIEYLTLLIAFPLGLMLSQVTKDEKNIYTKAPYFPVILGLLAITAAIFFTFDKAIALTLTFMFITTFIWNKF